MKFWIEKTIVEGRKDRLEGERALGKALWSPQEDKRGADIYKNMRLVAEGDIVLHFVDNRKFAGVSVVNRSYNKTTGLQGTEWEGPAYLIELKDFKRLNPPLDRWNILKEKNRSKLMQISSNSEVFYNSNLDLRQGAYLTPCPVELLQLINGEYLKLSGHDLPYVEDYLINRSNIVAIEEEVKSENTVQERNESQLKSLDLGHLFADLVDSGIKVRKELVYRFVCSLLAKPFVILTGLSGSGKTKLAQAFVKWITESESQYKIVPVGADWTNREPLLGYPNALESNKYVLPDNGVLSLIIEATKEANQNKPFFIILDEMNLSHVERYFADFLSAMESSEAIPLHDGSGDWADIPPSIKIPPNLFVIGTVNIDETTYMFSPKVLDRSSVIEFRVTEEDMKDFLNAYRHIALDKLNAKGAGVAFQFLDIAKNKEFRPKETSMLNGALVNFFNELRIVGAEFGYRSAAEIYRFSAVVNQLMPTWSIDDIVDCALMQKLLPKVHGSRRKLEPVIKTLGSLCLADGQTFDDVYALIASGTLSDRGIIKYPISFEKISRMYRGLLDNGFTSYAEA